MCIILYIYMYICIFPEIFIVLYIPRISFDEHHRGYRRELANPLERDRERKRERESARLFRQYFHIDSTFREILHGSRQSNGDCKIQSTIAVSLISRRSARYIRLNRPFFLPTCFFLRVPGALCPHFARARRRRRATPLVWIKALFARIDT
jgi:hypothetical protein